MLQQLTAATSAQTWAIGSLLFFFAVFLAVAIRVIAAKRGAYDRAARLPFDELPPASDGAPHQPEA